MDETPISAADWHQKIIELLPWYANGGLAEDESTAVEAHLARCPECREDLALERRIHADLPASGPLPDVDAGWAAMLDRIKRDDTSDAAVPVPGRPENVVALRPRSFLRRPVALGWAIAAQAAAAVLIVVGLGQFGATRAPAGPEYHALSSPAATGNANLLVMFRPDLREADLRGVLLANRAQLAGGPNASGAYLLRVAPGALAGTISRLRVDSRVTMAQPIDGGGQ